MKVSECLRELARDLDGSPPTVEFLRDKMCELIEECGKMAFQLEKLTADNAKPDLATDGSEPWESRPNSLTTKGRGR